VVLSPVLGVLLRGARSSRGSKYSAETGGHGNVIIFPGDNVAATFARGCDLRTKFQPHKGISLAAVAIISRDVGDVLSETGLRFPVEWNVASPLRKAAWRLV
jgi:hypothetical protein